MEIVIDIDENLYTRLFDNGVDNYDDAVDMAKAIRKGTPLPKNHGRLVDVNVIKNNIHYVPLAPIFQDDYVTYRNVIFADILDMLPTIIEGSESE